MSDIVVSVELADPGEALKAAIVEAAAAQVDALVKKFDFKTAIGNEINAQVNAMIAAEVGDKLDKAMGEKLKALVMAMIAPAPTPEAPKADV